MTLYFPLSPPKFLSGLGAVKASNLKPLTGTDKMGPKKKPVLVSQMTGERVG